jgi:hypothetical protein
VGEKFSGDFVGGLRGALSGGLWRGGGGGIGRRWWRARPGEAHLFSPPLLLANAAAVAITGRRGGSAPGAARSDFWRMRRGVGTGKMVVSQSQSACVWPIDQAWASVMACTLDTRHTCSRPGRQPGWAGATIVAGMELSFLFLRNLPRIH